MLCRKQISLLFDKCCEIFNTRNNVEVIQIFHEKLFYLESFLNDLYNIPNPKTVNINHVFQVKKESAHIGYQQEFYGEAESKHNYKKDTAYSGAQRKRRIRNIFKHLKHLEKTKLGSKRGSRLKSSAFLLSLKAIITGCNKTRQQKILNLKRYI